jgi:hypothetical protein
LHKTETHATLTFAMTTTIDSPNATGRRSSPRDDLYIIMAMNARGAAEKEEMALGVGVTH